MPHPTNPNVFAEEVLDILPFKNGLKEKKYSSPMLIKEWLWSILESIRTWCLTNH